MSSDHSFLDGEHGVIPLFRLGINVFPGELLPLHIFEDKYQRLLRYCLDEDRDEEQRAAGVKPHLRPFGVVLSARNTAQWGCSVEVEAILERHSDGRADILTRGMRVFELLHVLPEEDFPRAHIRWAETIDESPQNLREVVRSEFAIFLRNIDVDKSLPPLDSISAFGIGALIRLDVLERQELLNIASEKSRLVKLIDFLRFRNELVRRAGPNALKDMFSE
ncbi:MAG: LON peptidase substrate-binding domain-containing protein [Bdellovibrionales bacterium]|nr:LON peptidase substrate-binding domain-containing protein [Bdellovibrionales bacterium]